MQGVGNMDGKGWLATLNPVYDNSGEHHGSYQGVYQMTNGWDNFKIVDQTAGIWYGCDSNDEYKLADRISGSTRKNVVLSLSQPVWPT